MTIANQVALTATLSLICRIWPSQTRRKSHYLWTRNGGQVTGDIRNMGFHVPGGCGLGIEDSGSLQGNVSAKVLSNPYSLASSSGWMLA